jgi:hypothetical protein
MSTLKPGQRTTDAIGDIVILATIKGWLWCRRPGCVPFSMPLDDWDHICKEYVYGSTSRPDFSKETPHAP